MPVSWGQRKVLGRRYSYDPALAYELARLQNEYNLAPGREARGMQASQFTQSQEQQAGQFTQSQAQQAGQYGSSLAQQVSQFGQSQSQQESQYARSLEASQKNQIAAQEQWQKGYELSLANAARAKEEYDKNLKLATDQYNLAVQNAKDADERAKALLDYQKTKDELDRQAAEDAAKQQAQGQMYGTLGTLAGTGLLYYGLKGGGATKGALTAGEAAQLYQGTEAAPILQGMAGGEAGAASPTSGFFTSAYNKLFGPAMTDLSGGAGTVGGGAVPSTVAPVGQGLTTPLMAEPGVTYGGTTALGAEVGVGAGGATIPAGDFAAMMAAEDAAAGMGAGYGAGAGAGAGAATAGTAGGVAASTVLAYAAPAVIAAHYGMPVLGKLLGAQSPQDYRNAPSSSVPTQAANITAYEWDRPVEAGLNALNIETPDWLLGTMNPAAAIGVNLGIGSYQDWYNPGATLVRAIGLGGGGK